MIGIHLFVGAGGASSDAMADGRAICCTMPLDANIEIH